MGCGPPTPSPNTGSSEPAVEVATAIDQLLDAPLGIHQKVFPSALSAVPLRRVGEQGLNLRSGDLLLPAMVLREEALAHNLETMAAWCREQGVSLAPHGKTTMAPQLLHRQLEAGAWGITAATASQASIMQAHCVPRVVIANQVTDAAGLRWLATALDADPAFEVLCLVDSSEGVELLERALRDRGTDRRLRVLIELGVDGRRTGVRDEEQACSLARAVAESGRLALAGVECFEGVLGPGVGPDAVARVDTLLERVGGFARRLDAAGLFADAPEVVLSAGGSVFFDHAARLREIGELSRPVRVVLRSGCYVTHDDGAYDRMSPFGSRRGESGRERLRPALELWTAVLSRPERELAVLGFGKRDAPYDSDLPVALRLVGTDGDSQLDAEEIEVFSMNDQHALARVDAELALRPGDRVVFGISHPCTAFDKWSLLPVVDGADDVIGAVRTFF
jgi:D-serine deaminase-like pyridoxal phosphate-dependent protein